MRVRGFMVIDRIAEMDKNIEITSAKANLAEQNVLALTLKIERMKNKRDRIGRRQNAEEAAIERLQGNIERRIRKRERRMEAGENWLQSLHKSAVLQALPSQRNLKIREMLERSRPTFPELGLPTSTYLPTLEENKKQEQEQEEVQRQLENEIEEREGRERELLAEWTEEDTSMSCLTTLLSQHFHPQWTNLVEQRNREIWRRNELAGWSERGDEVTQG